MCFLPFHNLEPSRFSDFWEVGMALPVKIRFWARPIKIKIKICKSQTEYLRMQRPTRRTRGSNGRYSVLFTHAARWEETGTWTGSPAFLQCRPLPSVELRTHISLPGVLLSEHPCWLPAASDASDAFRRDSTMPAHWSCPCCRLPDLSCALEQEETDAHHGIPPLRFPWIPLPQTSRIALEHTARKGDAIDNKGHMDPMIRWERTRWKGVIALVCRWRWMALLV